MPYSSIADLPVYIRKQPVKTQRRWMAVWNSSYDACIKGGSSPVDCEGQAFARANGVIKGTKMSEPSGSSVHANGPLGVHYMRHPLMAAGTDDPGMEDEGPAVLLEKADSRVKYDSAGGSDAKSCEGCRFFDCNCNTCSLVEGTIVPSGLCSLWTEQLPDLVNQSVLPVGMAEGSTFQVFVDTPQTFAGADLTKPMWIPFLPKPGTYTHPVYGEIKITPEQNQGMVASVKDHVYQEHIPLDVEHQSKLSGAAAWIQDMRMNSDNSADALVEWTDRGQQLLGGGQFRYVSPEWWGEWTDPATGVLHKNVVAGGAITTRPFFKDKVLRALVASEAGVQIIGSGAAPYWFRDYSTEERQTMAKSGIAMPDGSFPIKDVTDLKNAVHDVGRAGHPDAAKAHIIKRARALGALDALPEDWTTKAAEGDRKMTDTIKAEGNQSGATGAPPSIPKTFTEAELDTKIKEATVTFAERLTAAEAKATAAETAAADEKKAREALTGQIDVLTKAARRQRFTEAVAGNGGSGDGAGWAGNPSVHLATLEGLADKFGEDNEIFTKYIENQQAVAAQLREAHLFGEVGSSGHNTASADDPTSRLDAMAKARMKDHPPETYTQAYTEVLATPEGGTLYGKLPVKS